MRKLRRNSAVVAMACARGMAADASFRACALRRLLSSIAHERPEERGWEQAHGAGNASIGPLSTLDAEFLAWHGRQPRASVGTRHGDQGQMVAVAKPMGESSPCTQQRQFFSCETLPDSPIAVYAEL